MNVSEWRQRRDNRSMRYAGRILDGDRWIHLSIDPSYASRYDGQVAVLTAVNLLGRMTPSVALNVPSAPLVDRLSWVGADLRNAVLDRLYKTDPYGRFCHRPPADDDYVIYLGAGAHNVVHGSGWNSYVGPGPSPLVDDDTTNPIGPALAVIIAVTVAFRSALAEYPEVVFFNALDWGCSTVRPDAAPLRTETSLGTLWTVGTGSVGTAILYFLSLATRRFSGTLFDMDNVKIENLDRSPIFDSDDVGGKKVDVAMKYLKNSGVGDLQAVPFSLDEVKCWSNRQEGAPDVVISTANERNVRSVIENAYPPIQIYATTGGNWQASVIRHVPLREPCSLCLFPESSYVKTACAQGTVGTAAQGNGDENTVDAALPFLSFAAGVMAAAELLKLSLVDYPFGPNRVTLNAWSPRIVQSALAFRDGCPCRTRSRSVHRRMIEGSRYGFLSLA